MKEVVTPALPRSPAFRFLYSVQGETSSIDSRRHHLSLPLHFVDSQSHRRPMGRGRPTVGVTEMSQVPRTVLPPRPPDENPNSCHDQAVISSSRLFAEVKEAALHHKCAHLK